MDRKSDTPLISDAHLSAPSGVGWVATWPIVSSRFGAVHSTWSAWGHSVGVWGGSLGAWGGSPGAWGGSLDTPVGRQRMGGRPECVRLHGAAWA